MYIFTQRWKKVQQPNLKKGNWDAAEDQLLQSAVMTAVAEVKSKSNDPTKDPIASLCWADIAKFVENRTGKSCRERWKGYLDPRVKRGPWAEDEDELMLRLQGELGNKWAKIAEGLEGRTADHVKTRYYSIQRRNKSGKPATKQRPFKPASRPAPMAPPPMPELGGFSSFLSDNNNNNNNNATADRDLFRMSGNLAGMALTDDQINELTADETSAPTSASAPGRFSLSNDRFSLSDALGGMADAPFPTDPSPKVKVKAEPRGAPQRQESLGSFMNELDTMPMRDSPKIKRENNMLSSQSNNDSARFSGLNDSARFSGLFGDMKQESMGGRDSMSNLLGDMGDFDSMSMPTSSSPNKADRLSQQLNRMSF